jgi:transcriptional regulator with XRE-family HTH domain
MAGRKKFSSLIEKMPAERRARSDARVQELRAEMLLAELRKHTGKTQAEVAALLGVSQPGLSRIESQDDIQISTLNRLVKSLGGKLELIAHMPGGDVTITQFFGK